MIRGRGQIIGLFVVLISSIGALFLASGVSRVAKAQQPQAESVSNEALPPPTDFVPEEVVNSGGNFSPPPIPAAGAEGYVYDPSGRRDPFEPPKAFVQLLGDDIKKPGTERPDQGRGKGQDLLANESPLLSYYLSDFRLVGVLWDVTDPKAMIKLSKGANSQVFMLRLKMKVGREKSVVASIREREVVFLVPDESGNYKNGQVRSLKMDF